MDVASRSRERVADRIERLEDVYGSFPVNQTTLSVPSPGYERARERCADGVADVYIELYNDDGEVLLVRGEDSWKVPQGRTDSDEPLEAGAKREVRETVGVECSVDGLHRVTIAGVTDESNPDREPVYRLLAVFVCELESGQPDGAARWETDLPEKAAPAF
jgi:ADP-ribose pyrophosphatase YjhB (NUDIX family)